MKKFIITNLILIIIAIALILLIMLLNYIEDNLMDKQKLEKHIRIEASNFFEDIEQQAFVSSQNVILYDFNLVLENYEEEKYEKIYEARKKIINFIKTGYQSKKWNIEVIDSVPNERISFYIKSQSNDGLFKIEIAGTEIVNVEDMRNK